MLIQFSVANYKSFHGETTFSFLPAKRIVDHKDHLICDEAGKTVEVLPVAAIFGANASGKSNLVDAIRFAKKLILKGSSEFEQIQTNPFKLDLESITQPSLFEFSLKHEGVVYTYGFKVTATEVKEEWLYAVYEQRRVLLFERVSGEVPMVIKAGSSLAKSSSNMKQLRFIEKSTRKNQLFLKKLSENNNEIISPLMKWFQYHLEIMSPNYKANNIVLRAHDDKTFIDYISGFLRLADTGIHQLICLSEDFDVDRHFGYMPEPIRADIVEKMNTIDSEEKMALLNQKSNSNQRDAVLIDGIKRKYLNLNTEHVTTEGEPISFDLDDESDGTIRLMDYSPVIYDLQKNDKTYIIDELDRSLHPHLTRLLIESHLKGSSKQNVRGQLLFTTHESSLLDLELLRPDEIWFMEKDKGYSSHLTSLSDYKIRKDLRIERNYLIGRFGAIPFIGNLNELIGEE